MLERSVDQKSEDEPEKIYLSLGGNVGNGEAILLSALKMIDRQFHLTAVSNLYRTIPQIVRDQQNFWNCVASFLLFPNTEQAGSPVEILHALQSIETYYGRNRKTESSKGPRPLDIDIIFFGKRIVNDPSLVIPHPAYMIRRFVLVPLLEIDPDMRDVDGKLIKKYAHVNDQKQGIYLSNNDEYNDFMSALRTRV